MFPRSSAWPSFIEDGFALIDTASQEPASTDESLADWRRRGGYFVNGHSSKEFHINCAKAEFSNVMLSEVELLLDHIAEQRTQVALAVSTNGSPSWTLVSVYYWAIFASLAWLRLVGRPLVYLYGDDITSLIKLNVGQTSRSHPRSGAFSFTTDPAFNGGTRMSLTLKHSNASNFHEGIWQELTKYFKAKTSAPKLKLTPESRIISTLSDFNGTSSFWPSQLRNSVNYKPGFSYQSVHGIDTLQTIKVLGQQVGKSLQDLVSQYELNCSRTPTDRVDAAPGLYAEALVLRTIILDCVLNEFRDEIASRLSFKGSRKTRRKSFLKRQGLIDQNGNMWPYVTDWRP